MSALDKVLLSAGVLKKAPKDDTAGYLVLSAQQSVEEALNATSLEEVAEALLAVKVALAGLETPEQDDWVELTACPADEIRLASDDEESDGNKKPYGDVAYADPGYQADGKARYPVDEKHIHAAISYFSKAKNRAQYTAAQVKSIWGRIKSAAKKHGVQMSDDTVAASAMALAAGKGGKGTPLIAFHHGPFTGRHSHPHTVMNVHDHEHDHNSDSRHPCGDTNRDW